MNSTTGAAELPEALRLAADLSSIFISEEIHATKARKIAAELRRLCQSEREGWRYADELKQDLDRLHAQVEALSAAQAGAPVIPAMMYLMLTDAMGYDSGEDGTTWSPEDWAAHLYSFYKSKTAPAQPGQEGEREAFIRWYMEYLHTDEMLAAYVWDNEHIVPQTWRAARAQADIGAAPAGEVAAGIEAAAKLLERKADDFARENGSDDLGSLSFGRGAHADAKLEYHSTLLELAEEIRSLASPPPAQAADSALEDAALSQAARDVLAERQRQINAEGWTPEHDDEHGDRALCMAAVCYVLGRTTLRALEWSPDIMLWPWEKESWKPKDPRQNLIKAGALILAELERIDRAARKQGGKP